MENFIYRAFNAKLKLIGYIATTISPSARKDVLAGEFAWGKVHVNMYGNNLDLTCSCMATSLTIHARDWC